MAMIDILKLNEELDKMIATQETEIKQIDERIEADFASQWAEMVRDLWTLDSYARRLGMVIGEIYAGTMPAEKSVPCWWDVLYYQFGGNDYWTSVVAYGKNYRGNIATMHLVSSDSEMNRTTMTLLKYWKERRDKIHADFEAACVTAIKEKAEHANAKYHEALERKERIL